MKVETLTKLFEGVFTPRIEIPRRVGKLPHPSDTLLLRQRISSPSVNSFQLPVPVNIGPDVDLTTIFRELGDNAPFHSGKYPPRTI